VLAAKKPAIIVCDISGYGANGPYRDKKAYDLLIQSEAGLVSVTGTPDEPCKAGPSMADIAAGMYAYTNILAALLQRGQTGRGQHIDISMLESLAEWTSYPLYYAFDGAPPPPRTGAAHATIYPYGPFPTGADGGSVMLGLQNEREWVNFCDKVLQRPELARDPRFSGNAKRVAERTALRAIIVETFAPLTTPQVVDRLEAAQIANARVNTMHEVWEHPQLKARQRWREVGSRSELSPRCCHPALGTKARAWTRARRSASTPTPSSASSASTRPASASCERRRPSDGSADLPVRAGQSTGALRQGTRQRRR
jgi:crotonobetainyl-CoA:carnitine CoA-transferase CaiB-like acyl-CoA transferase